MYSFLSVRDGAVTVNENAVEPPAAESVTVATPAAALDAMLNVADAELPALLVVMFAKVNPDHPVASDTPQRLLPFIVTLTLVPRAPLAGVAELITGPAGGLIVTGAETVTHAVLSVFFTAVNT